MNDRLTDVTSEDCTEVSSELGHVVGNESNLSSPRKLKKRWNSLLKKQKKTADFEEEQKLAGEKELDEKDAHLNDSPGDIELGNINAEVQHMETFFRDVETIKENIDSIKKAVTLIREINQESLHASKAEKETRLNKRLEPVLDETNKTAKQTKKHLSLLKEETTKLGQEGELKESNMRVRENLVNTLTRKFVDEIKLYQSAQQKYKMDIKSKASRQIKTIMPDATEEEIDVVIRSEGGRESLYEETILAGGVADPVNTAYAKVASRYQDVLTLEHSLAELHQMFVDTALLTEQQGELLDHIEIQVQKASNAVEDGNGDLVKSIDYQKAIRKKQCWIIGIVLIIALVVFVVLFG